jgi:serine/threonine protein kinase
MKLDGPAQSSDQLLHCTLERTVVRIQNPATGQAEVLKLLLRGSLNEAERELEWGQLAGGEGVVRYLNASIDSHTGRPCLRTEFHPGADLEALVARRGAFDAATACLILLPVAESLAVLHSTRTPALPQGLCHGDIKPSNLLRTESTTLMLDFEHAGPIASGRCAGTIGFAAPEAETGARLSPYFDVYGLGATLHWLLTGTTPRQGALAMQDAELQLLVAACTAHSPAARPTASVVARKLHELSLRLSGDPAEPVRNALLAGELSACNELLQEKTIPVGTFEILGSFQTRQQRLLARLRQLPSIWAPLGSENAIAETTKRLRQLESFLRRYPRHSEAISARNAAREHAGRQLHHSLPRLNEYVRNDSFPAARALLLHLEALAHSLLASPGRLRVPCDHDPRMPTLLQRAPLSCLQQEAQRIDAAAADSDRLAAAIEEAENRFAIDEIEAIIEHLATNQGGTSSVVTRRRDRLQRLSFYLTRISRSTGNLKRLQELLPTAELKPVVALIAECATAAALGHHEMNDSVGAMGMRQLQLTFTNLIDEFATLRDRVAPANEGLRIALESLTDEAWQLLADAQQKLQAEPVPIRPLQLLLGRLDTFRLLEALIDRPMRARSQVIDRIESLRLRLEQALAARDRLARGAEQAIAKGHWTTGLFEMERAVTSIDGEDSAESYEANKLKERLTQARKRKLEIEQNQRHNNALESRYIVLQADPKSSGTERLRTLRERRDCLQFLNVHAQQDRGRLYARDLRKLEQRIVEEQALIASASFEEASDIDERLLFAQQTMAQIDAFREEGGPSAADLEAIRALGKLWQERLATTLAAVERRAATVSARARHKRLLRRMVAVAAVTLVGAVALLFGSGEAAAAQESRLAKADLGAVAQNIEIHLASLRKLAAKNESAQSAVDQIARLNQDTDLVTWHQGLVQSLTTPGVAPEFAKQCWRIGIGRAAAFASNAQPKQAQLYDAVLHDRPRLEQFFGSPLDQHALILAKGH